MTPSSSKNSRRFNHHSCTRSATRFPSSHFTATGTLSDIAIYWPSWDWQSNRVPSCKNNWWSDSSAVGCKFAFAAAFGIRNPFGDERFKTVSTLIESDIRDRQPTVPKRLAFSTTLVTDSDLPLFREKDKCPGSSISFMKASEFSVIFACPSIRYLRWLSSGHSSCHRPAAPRSRGAAARSAARAEPPASPVPSFLPPPPPLPAAVAATTRSSTAGLGHSWPLAFFAAAASH